MTIREIAATIGMSPSYVHKVAKQLGLPPRPRGGKRQRWHEARLREIAERRAKGETYREIARALGSSPATVFRRHRKG